MAAVSVDPLAAVAVCAIIVLVVVAVVVITTRNCLVSPFGSDCGAAHFSLNFASVFFVSSIDPCNILLLLSRQL